MLYTELQFSLFRCDGEICLPIIWQILWRTGLGLIMLTEIALFLEGLKSEAQSKP